MAVMIAHDSCEENVGLATFLRGATKGDDRLVSALGMEVKLRMEVSTGLSGQQRLWPGTA